MADGLVPRSVALIASRISAELNRHTSTKAPCPTTRINDWRPLLLLPSGQRHALHHRSRVMLAQSWLATGPTFHGLSSLPSHASSAPSLLRDRTIHSSHQADVAHPPTTRSHHTCYQAKQAHPQHVLGEYPTPRWSSPTTAVVLPHRATWASSSNSSTSSL